MKVVTVISLMLLSNWALSQNEDLNFYGDVMINAAEDQHRERASLEFLKIFDAKIKEAKGFSFDLSSIPWVSKLYDADSTFRVISWQVKVSEEAFKYYGYIQTKDGKLYELKDKSDEMEDVEYLSTSMDDWYGALYYNIHECTIGEEKVYFLFGYDGYNKYEVRKVVEVLTNIESGNPTLGKELFYKLKKEQRPDIKQRLMLEYSSDSNVTLNYNPGLEMIVHDHLIARQGNMQGQGSTQLSDGSLVGYEWKNDRWEYLDRIYTQTEETAPRPQPVLGKKKKDLFGKKTKK